ncbi:hypothetical protein LZ24_03466 [Desulfobotulus alkaliphilus]|uniref:Uncharacterized protein n=1 Tax=Desulfobotulus alkaliphilus TaxID=622671 RepID=A0A562QWD1_9BACT|nr:hypothetical protein [Desulfobotulus alkaliphilus]TWI61099.1 hypothetical protein LZ24_03466 [Desulfobotulus alkaliphilus]
MLKKTILLVAALLCFSCASAEARRLHHERWYQDQWCDIHEGKTEVRLADGTRADCVTTTIGHPLVLAAKSCLEAT